MFELYTIFYVSEVLVPLYYSFLMLDKREEEDDDDDGDMS